MSANLSEIAKQAYAQYDAQLIKVSHAQSETNAAENMANIAKQKALLCQRNLDAQNRTAKRFTKAAIAAAKEVAAQKHNH